MPLCASDPVQHVNPVAATDAGLPLLRRVQFDSAGCACEASLSNTLKAVGIDSTPAGLAGGT